MAANFAGNPVAAQGTSAYHKLLLDVCPRIEIIDGMRLQGGRKKVRLARQMREEASKRQSKAGLEDMEPKRKEDVLEDGNEPETRTVQKPEEKTRKKRKSAGENSAKKTEDDGNLAAIMALESHSPEKKLRKKRKLSTTERQKKGNDEPGSVARTDSVGKTKTESSLTPSVGSPKKENKTEKKKKKRKRENDGESIEISEVAKASAIMKQSEDVVSPEDDDDALDAAEFLKRANALKAGAGASLLSYPDEEKKAQRKTRKRSKKHVNRKERTSMSFGDGGESQWY